MAENFGLIFNGFFVPNKCFETNSADSRKVFTQQSELQILCLLDATLKVDDLII